MASTLQKDEDFGGSYDNIGRCVSCPNTDIHKLTEDRGKNRLHVPLRSTRSLNSSPSYRHKVGIPLGSQTARLASRSFWNPDMLKRSMDEIAQSVAKEASNLGSSLESLHDSEEDFSDHDIQVSEEEREHPIKMKLDNKEARELRNPLSTFLKNNSKNSGCRTPPYFSPGLTRKLETDTTEQL